MRVYLFKTCIMQLTNNVVKHNKLIEAPCTLSLQAQKVVLIFIAMINAHEKKLKPFYQVSMKTMCYYMGLNKSGSYRKQIERAVRKVGKEDIYLHDNLIVKWFSSFEFLDNGQIEVEFSQKLQWYLTDLKSKGNFTPYKLQNILPVKLKYSIKIYELLKQYKKFKERTFTLEDLRYKLGIPADKYTNWKDFRKRIINPVQIELYDTTNIGFKYFPLTYGKGKNITGVRFTIFDAKAEKAKPFIDGLIKIEKGIKDLKEVSIDPNSKNTQNFDNVLRRWIDNRSNWPLDMSFTQFVNADGWNIKELPTGGKDLVPFGQQKL